jgi:hypothetical protein
MGVDPVGLWESSRLFKRKKPRISSRFDVGVDPVEVRENPRPAACKEKKTHFQIFNPHSMY